MKRVNEIIDGLPTFYLKWENTAHSNDDLQWKFAVAAVQDLADDQKRRQEAAGAEYIGLSDGVDIALDAVIQDEDLHSRLIGDFLSYEEAGRLLKQAIINYMRPWIEKELDIARAERISGSRIEARS